jgi:hypothetical protein
MSKFSIYPYLFPFRTRLQRRLREERLQVDYSDFAEGINDGPLHETISRFLWNCLSVERALVPDFRPEVNDDLAKVYAMGPEEIIDDILEPLTAQLNLDVSGIDFKALGFDSIKTPADVAHFVMKMAIASEVIQAK